MSSPGFSDPDGLDDPSAEAEEAEEAEEEMVRKHCQVNGQKSEQAAGDGEEQGNLACCSPQGCEESALT